MPQQTLQSQHTGEPPAVVHGAPFDFEQVGLEMERLWPQLFGPELHVPLKVGITNDLHAEAIASGSTLSKRKIRLFLGRYCSHPEYLRLLASGVPRHDHNGIPIESDVEARHIKSANKRLERYNQALSLKTTS